MLKAYTFFLTSFLFASSFALLGAALFFHFSEALPYPEESLKKASVTPKSVFSFTDADLERIGSHAFSVKEGTWKMRLPDLRHQLIYQGINGRPDVLKDQTILHFSLAQDKSTKEVLAKTPLYLFFDKKETPPRITFSPENKKTSLWIVGIPRENQVDVELFMLDEKEERVLDPPQFSHFTLQEKETPKGAQIKNWEMGKWKVDGTLLGRQRARWYGKDVFLEAHGGEEYSSALGKHRIDFGEGDEIYSIYVGQGDCLIWGDEMWEVALPGKETLGRALMHVKRMDERLLTLELWDTDGKTKIHLNLLKSQEAFAPQELKKQFKFIASRTRTKFVFEAKGKRVILRPSDWLLLQGGAWKKLESEEEIDDYVARKTPGVLFIFEGLVKKEGRSILKGQFYNATRTQAEAIEIPVLQSSLQALAQGENKGKKKDARYHRYEEEDYDDDDDEDDEDIVYTHD